ncbi:hypothetical protein EV182_008167, partial [Spiromyces aspiralis]
DIKCWKIECLTEGVKDGPSYVYSNKAIVITDCLFGWHMQCFLRSLNMPPKGSKLKHDVVIKDSWLHMADKHCDEVELLRWIRDALSGKEGINLEYPHLLHGSCVKLWTGAANSDSKPAFITDDADNFYCGLPTTIANNHDSGEYNSGGNITAKWPFCKHWQIVIEP